MLLAGSMLPAINICKHVPMPASRGQFIHCKYPLYNRLAGGISDVVGTEERRLELRTSRGVVLINQELDSVTQRLVYRLARRLDLTRFDLIGSLVTGGLVDRGLLFVRGLVAESFVNRSFVVKRSRSLWKDLCL
jgi:hypothetical protein